MVFEKRLSVFVLKDNKGKVLLQKKGDDTKYSGCWGFFGGMIKNSETPKETAIREAKKELGIVLNKPKFFRRYELPGSDGELHEYFVFTSSLPKGIIKSKKKDSENIGLFTFDDAMSMMFIEHEIVILEDLFDKRQKTGFIEVEKKT